MRDHVHTNGIESFWAMFKRGQKGVYHRMSKNTWGRYATGYIGRHNKRPLDTDYHVSALVKRTKGGANLPPVDCRQRVGVRGTYPVG